MIDASLAWCCFGEVVKPLASGRVWVLRMGTIHNRRLCGSPHEQQCTHFGELVIGGI